MDLFSKQREDSQAGVAPLAVRMRPATLDEFLGQEHFIGEGKLLRRMLQAGRMSSAIFYGPPGCGKTTLARIVSGTTDSVFEELHAAEAGVKEVRELSAQAKARLSGDGRRTILFIDELHRFNKTQQDVLLDDVERGIVVFLGATTENPFFSVNAPLVSRSQVFEFEPLTIGHITELLNRALADPDRGLGRHRVKMTEQALQHLARVSDGDARRALNALEVAVLSQVAAGGPVTIDLQVAQDSIQRKALRYDRLGDEHYDAASALIKSMRGSDPDAAVYWLARMLAAGEDPRFVARRIAICAAEDIGNADPRALLLANAAFQVTLQVGMPECQLPLAQAVIYLACAPKSDACAQAIWQAAGDVLEQRTVPVPRVLRTCGHAGSGPPQRGGDYENPHRHPHGYVQQDYLGVERRYYEPTDRGYEATLRTYLERLRRAQDQEPPRG